jgi:hypothetical protein
VAKTGTVRTIFLGPIVIGLVFGVAVCSGLLSRNMSGFPRHGASRASTLQETAMPLDLNATIRQALGKLEAEKSRIERQISALRQALRAGLGMGSNAADAKARVTDHRGGRMSSSARKAVSVRMKAYWAKRKAARPRGKKRVA